MNLRVRFRVFLGLAVLMLVVAGLVLGTPLLPAEVRGRFSDVALIFVAATVAPACWWTARQATGRVRRSWLLLAVAGALWTLGEAGWIVFRGSEATTDGSSPADVFSLVAVIPAALALLWLPPPGRVGRDRAITLLGCVVAVTSVLFVARSVELSLGASPFRHGVTFSDLVYVAYPVSDLVILSLVLVALIRLGDRARVSLLVLGAGLVCYATSDGAYAVFGALDSYRQGTVLDLGWFAGYLLMALAALVPGATRPTPTRVVTWRAWSALAVYLPVLAAAVTAAALPSFRPDLTLVLAGAVILSSFGVRQVLLASDLARLTRQQDEQLTVLRETGTRLRRQVQQTQRITEAVADGILVLDSEHRVTMANGSALWLVKRDAESLLGRPLDELLGSSVGTDRGVVLRAVDRGTVLTAHESAVLTPDGAVPVELTVGPILEHERLVGTVLVIRDITERQAVDRMKNEFLSVISHELRTPLTSIRGSLALLDGGMGGELAGAGARMVTLALQSSERLTRLIDDLLDMERMESGRLTMAPEDASALHLIELAERELGGFAAQHGVEVITTGSAGVSDRVWADPDRIVQTLVNLIGNAIKFSHHGGQVRVGAWPAGDGIEFSVADDGRGIPAEKLETVFERFEQVDSSDSRRNGGTGLGLAICRNIISLHGGRIWVSSELGRGSDFRFWLPVPAPANRSADLVRGAERPSPAVR